MKKIIAITGGIGSGKSVALNLLKDAGFLTFSCDQIVSDLYNKRRVKKLLRKEFPAAVSGVLTLKLDRSIIAKQVFNNKKQLDKLNALILPLVFLELDKRLKKITGLAFVEVPLLFETNCQNRFDQVLVITRNLNDRIESASKRSNISKEQVKARILAQVDYDSLDLSPYVVIQNDGDLQEFTQKVLSFANGLCD